MLKFQIDSIQDSDRPWLRQLWTEHWGGPLVITRGQAHHANQLPGFIARAPDGQIVGVATYQIESPPPPPYKGMAQGADSPPLEGGGRGEVELVSLDSLAPGQGIGSALIDAVRQSAEAAGCLRLWLITTNDNLPALRFYQRRGFRLAAVHAGAVNQTRRLKPGIPEIGLDGIPLRDEIELELPLIYPFAPGKAAVRSLPALLGGGAGGEGSNPAGIRLARRPIYESRWVNLYLDHMRTPSGLEITDYHIVDYPNDAVAAYVTNAQNEVLMGQYYRYAIGELRWEIPAGGVEPGEDPLAAAQREVLEETGYTSYGYTHYSSYFPAAGSGNKRFHLVRGFAGERTGPHDPDELAAVAWFPISTLRQLIHRGEISDGYTLTALLLAWELKL